MDLFKGTINDAGAQAKEIIAQGQQVIGQDLIAIEQLVRRLIEGYVITIQAVPKPSQGLNKPTQEAKK